MLPRYKSKVKRNMSGFSKTRFQVNLSLSWKSQTHAYFLITFEPAYLS